MRYVSGMALAAFTVLIIFVAPGRSQDKKDEIAERNKRVKERVANLVASLDANKVVKLEIMPGATAHRISDSGEAGPLLKVEDFIKEYSQLKDIHNDIDVNQVGRPRFDVVVVSRYQRKTHLVEQLVVVYVHEKIVSIVSKRVQLSIQD